MWVMLGGAFLSSRGAIFPALSSGGFSPGEVKRSWRAFRYGGWSVTRLLSAWREHVLREGNWQGHLYEGYQAVAVDITSFGRPRLENWLGKAFSSLLGKAVKAQAFGLVGEVGSVAEQRLALPRKLLRGCNEVGSEQKLKAELLSWVAAHLGAAEVGIFDAGFKLAELQAAGVERYVLRQASNCTARRNSLPSYKGRGARPKYGERVRPLARSYKANTLAATQADETTSFTLDGRLIRVKCWHKLIRPEQTPCDSHACFSLLVFDDPLYKTPLVLATSLPLEPKSLFLLYRDRWAIEQLPLAAKQMLGVQRSFVFHPESVARLPELALLVGNILSYLAATLPPIPTGFWDIHPKKRQGAYAGL